MRPSTAVSASGAHVDPATHVAAERVGGPC